MTTIQDRIAAAQNKTQRYVGSRNVQLRDMMKKGILITISVHGAGIFDSKLNFAELGIDPAAIDGQRIKAGHKSLAPGFSRRLNSWATQCRQAPNKFCIRLSALEAATASQSWRLLLFEGYEDFNARWDELEATRVAIVQDAIESYDDLMEASRRFFLNLAIDNWRAMQARYPGGVALNVAGRTFGPVDGIAYADWVVDSALAGMPTPEQIRVKVHAEYHTSILFTEAEKAEEEAVLAEAQERSEAARNRAMLQREIRDLELEKARTALQSAADPFVEAMGALLSEITAAADTVLRAYKKGSFKGRALAPAQSLGQLYRRLGGAMLDNVELERLIVDLTSLAESKPTRDNREKWQDEIAEKMMSIRELATSEARDLAKVTAAQTRAGAIEL